MKQLRRGGSRGGAVLVAWLSCVATSGCAGSGIGSEPSDLRAELEGIQARSGVPALAGAVGDGQSLIAAAATGVRRLGDATSVSDDDRFSIGSAGKAMTVTLIGILVEDGRLDWDDRVSAIFPELATRMDPRYETVTVRHLLAHRAGLVDEQLLPILQAELPTELSVMDQRHWVVERTLAEPPARVGEHLYSTVGYVIAGAVAERAAGERWESMIMERLFRPLGMTSTGFDTPERGYPQFAWPHNWIDGALSPVEPGPDPVMTVGRPAGGIHVSLADWHRFARAHLNGALGQSSVVSADTFAEMHTPWPGEVWAGESYALGWRVSHRGNEDVLVHSGRGPQTAEIEIWPQRGRIVLTVSNCSEPVGVQATSAALPILRRMAGI
jgi:CubicO group peptidase (beta-lactamase class C family)